MCYIQASKKYLHDIHYLTVKKSYYHSSIGHTGLDFPVREGTPVYAIGDGTITLNYDQPSGWGTNLLIRHEVNAYKINPNK